MRRPSSNRKCNYRRNSWNYRKYNNRMNSMSSMRYNNLSRLNSSWRPNSIMRPNNHRKYNNRMRYYYIRSNYNWMKYKHKLNTMSSIFCTIQLSSRYRPRLKCRWISSRWRKFKSRRRCDCKRTTNFRTWCISSTIHTSRRKESTKRSSSIERKWKNSRICSTSTSYLRNVRSR